MIENVYIIPVLQEKYIYKNLLSLYKYTPNNFKVIIVDMTLGGLPDIDGVHMKLRPHRNLGFAKAMNEGMIHAIHWDSEYITCMNDDVELMNKRWWQGILDTFNMKSEKEIIVAAPESPRIPLWGYGDTQGNFVEVIPYKDFTDADYDYLLKGNFELVNWDTKGNLLPKTFPKNYVGVCDAMAAWMPIFKTSRLYDIGLWDERFYPGSGEDYDMMTRIYSKGYRAVSTRGSWVWHWWGGSKDNKNLGATGLPIDPKRQWNKLGELWPKEENEGHNMDVWGNYTNSKGERVPFKRVPEIGVVEI